MRRKRERERLRQCRVSRAERCAPTKLGARARRGTHGAAVLFLLILQMISRLLLGRAEELVDWSRWDIRGACGANPRIRNPAALLSSWCRSPDHRDVRCVCPRVSSSWSTNIAIPGDRVGGFAPYARHAITVERSSSRREHGSRDPRARRVRCASRSYARR